MITLRRRPLRAQVAKELFLVEQATRRMHWATDPATRLVARVRVDRRCAEREISRLEGYRVLLTEAQIALRIGQPADQVEAALMQAAYDIDVAPFQWRRGQLGRAEPTALTQ